jgi:hypothetical protein
LIALGVVIPSEVRVLALKPYMMVQNYSSYCVNNCTFQTSAYGKGKATQCDGVSVVAKPTSFASSKDKNPALGDITYYGRVNEIIEMNYSNEGSVVLFKCDWVKQNGVRDFNDFGIIQVNFNHLYGAHEVNSEPYILASQATQIYYVQDPVEPDWQTAICPTIRDYYDMESKLDDEN